METQQKQRLMGMAVVTGFLVLVVPMLFHHMKMPGPPPMKVAAVTKPVIVSPPAQEIISVPVAHLQGAAATVLPSLPSTLTKATAQSSSTAIQTATTLAAIQSPTPSSKTTGAMPIKARSQTQPAKQPISAAKQLPSHHLKSPQIKPVSHSPQPIRHHTAAKSPTSKAAVTPPQGWSVQLGTFKQVKNAETLVSSLKKQHIQAFIRKTKASGKRPAMVKVFTAAQKTQRGAQQLASRLNKQFHLQGIVVRG